MIPPKKGFSAAQLAGMAGKSRPAIEADIASLERLGLLTRKQIGKRDRFFPRSTRLAKAINALIRAVDDAVGI
jgi:DNA-binding transcriptional ArsR family regulator